MKKFLIAIFAVSLLIIGFTGNSFAQTNGQPCGQPGNVCSPGFKCITGLGSVCVPLVCSNCGTAGLACCDSGCPDRTGICDTTLTCTNGLGGPTCTQPTCTGCGDERQLCCSSACTGRSSVCNGSLVCIGTVCAINTDPADCGKNTKACCIYKRPCDPDLSCALGICISLDAPNCGHDNNACCITKTPPCETGTTCIGGMCRNEKSTGITIPLPCDPNKNPNCNPTCPDKKSINTAIGCIPIDSIGSFFLRWGVGIAGGISILLIIYAGIVITTARGDPKRLNGGKELLTSAIAGLILLIFSIFILRLIGVKILGIF